MQTKTLGRTGLALPSLGLGTGWLGLIDQNLGEALYRDAPRSQGLLDREIAVATITTAINHGVRYIDTAPWYGSGNSERAVGEALDSLPKAIASEVIVSTKIGHLFPGDDYDFSYDAAMRSFEASQNRTGVDRFKLVYLHDPMNQDFHRVMGPRGVFAAMRELRKQKLIDWIGIGANDPFTALKYALTGEFDAVLAVASWSMLNQSARHIFGSVQAEHNIGIVSANALERGILATGYVNGINYQERNFTPEMIAHIGRMQNLCARHGIPLAAAAIQWCLREHSSVNCAAVIPGARIREQILANVDAANTVIPEQFWEDLQPLIRTWNY